MWIFTRHGFFSVVCARRGDGGHDQPVDPDRVMVRARRRDHLEGLRRRFPEISACEIYESPEADYRHRIFVSKAAWCEVLAALGAEMDYDNFKDTAERCGASEAYTDALHEVWDTMHGLQADV